MKNIIFSRISVINLSVHSDKATIGTYIYYVMYQFWFKIEARLKKNKMLRVIIKNGRMDVIKFIDSRNNLLREKSILY